MPIDRVQPLKIESLTTGSDEDMFPTSLDKNEDYVEARGFAVQDAGSNDETTVIDRVGNDLRFKDGNNATPLTLTELLSGAGGITESSHKALRDLIHFIEGPADGWTSAAYYEQLPSANPFPTSAIWWESASKLNKIVELTTAYNANKTIATEVWKMYDTDGSTVLVTLTDTYSYSGGVFLSTVTRTWAWWGVYTSALVDIHSLTHPLY